MNEDLYWEAQWAICELEQRRQRLADVKIDDPATDDALDVLLQLKR